MAKKKSVNGGKTQSKKRKFDKSQSQDNNTVKGNDNKEKRQKLDSKAEFKEIVEEKWGLTFPDDFYSFYDFVQDSKDDLLKVTELRTTGPFSLLDGKISKETAKSSIELNMHGRHYYDSPEMSTVLYSKEGCHIAYFRDHPSELPQLLVNAKYSTNGELVTCGDNLFAAVHLYCKDLLKTKGRSNKTVITAFMGRLATVAKAHNLSLDANSAMVKRRQKSVVAKSFNKIGLVVPVDKNDVGYRELPSTDRELKKLLTKIASSQTEEEKTAGFDELQEIITLVQFANDECDYGMGYELGMDLFTFGTAVFHNVVVTLLPLAYQLMKRDFYAEILNKHLEGRKDFISLVDVTN